MNHRAKYPVALAKKSPAPASPKPKAASRTPAAQTDRVLEGAGGNRAVNPLLAPPAIQAKQNSASMKTSTQPREPLPQPSATATSRLSVGDHALQTKGEGLEGIRRESSAAQRPNHTGLPDGLKSGVESLSGMSLDHVKVHYNSSQPEQLNALAYAQGSHIHVTAGQEHNLPHEAWHVVQQAQGRVQPTMQMKNGVPVNGDQGLEHEADVMGVKALAQGRVKPTIQQRKKRVASDFPGQAKIDTVDSKKGPQPTDVMRVADIVQRLFQREPEAEGQKGLRMAELEDVVTPIMRDDPELLGHDIRSGSSRGHADSVQA